MLLKMFLYGNTQALGKKILTIYNRQKFNINLTKIKIKEILSKKSRYQQREREIEINEQCYNIYCTYCIFAVSKERK